MTQWKHRTWKQEQEVIKLTNGHSIAQISEMTGLSKWTVMSVQRKYHLVLSFGQSISSSQFRYQWDHYAWGRVIEDLYYTQGMTMKEVAKVLGISPGTLGRRMNILGLHRVNKRGKGRKRGPHQYFNQFPVCITKGCTTRVMKEGENRCAACRHSKFRREHGVRS